MNPFRALLAHWKERTARDEAWAMLQLKARYHAFRVFLENNARALELIVSIDGLLAQGEDGDLADLGEELLDVTGELVDGLNLLSGDAHAGLYATHGTLTQKVRAALDAAASDTSRFSWCRFLDDLDGNAARQAGNKAANLGLLRSMGLPVPDGFVCTTRACHAFLDSGDLSRTIQDALRAVQHGQADMTDAARHIREAILAAPLPWDFEACLRDSHARLTADRPDAAVSMRSSGAAEDRPEHTFAGQFTSVLNVRGFEALCAAYREVVASAFSPRAMSYRRHAGLDGEDAHLGVLCQLMVRPRCAGVLMTRDPAKPREGRMLISAVPGLGTLAVGGGAPADLYRPWRLDASPATGAPDHNATVAHKTAREVALPDGGVRREDVPEKERDLALLGAEQIARLARLGEMIENLDGMPQDIEWAVDDEENIVLLQTRPLRVAPGSGAPVAPAATALLTGMSACPGKAVGRALIALSTTELTQAMQILPPDEAGGRILILPQGLVDAARFLPMAAGVVVDTGNPADHLSCVAREYATPMITGTGNATRTLAPGQWIVLDADNAQVLEAPPSLRTANTRRPAERPDAPGGRASESPKTARHALRALITPLNLTDADTLGHGPRTCRTVHDLIRYAHEMAVLRMFQAGDEVMEQAGGLLRPLDLGVPFHFLVIDVGGGVRRERGKGGMFRRALLGPDDIRSTPLKALCEGLTTPGLSWHVAPQVTAMSRILSRDLLDRVSARPVGSFNYALAGRDYLNLNSRVEYHFAMLDALCGDDTQTNHIRFRFQGGGAGPRRAERRARFLDEVLRANGFTTSVQGDLLTAALTGANREATRERLVMLGRLIGFTRCLDAVMGDDATPRRLARAFLAGCLDAEEALRQNDQE